ncbi:MAG TPA: DUF4474 domain-containing protein [Clostridiales bacterium]|nr:DUF4474 domain-containing protein [Clostridiales bacterium]
MKSLFKKIIAAFLAAVFVLGCVPFTLTAASAVDAPGIPEGAAAQYASPTSVIITWNAVDGATGYVVYRSLSASEGYQRMKVTAALSATDTAAVPGVVYYYKVRAYTAGDTGNIYGTPADAVSPPGILPAPVSPAAVSVNLTSIKTSWAAVAGAAGYVLYRSSSAGGTYKTLKITASRSFTDTGLTPGATYYYKVRAYAKVNGVTVYGKTSAAFSGLAAPAVPANCIAVFTSTTSATLAWDKVSGATGYVLYYAERQNKNGPYKRLKVLKGNSYVHNGIDVTDANYYKVCAYQTYRGANIYGKPSAAFAPKSDPVISYQYDADGNYFYTEKDPWQRNFGFNPLYDWFAPITAMFYSSVRVKFTYNGLDWMIQLWKGQYGFAFIGSEIGIYHKPATRPGTHYDSASDANSLKIEQSLYRQKAGSDNENDLELKFTRPYAIYWWSTGFVAGQLRRFADTGELMMVARITFKDNGMANAFVEKFDALGFEASDSVNKDHPDTYKVVGRDVYINWRYIGRATGTYVG